MTLVLFRLSSSAKAWSGRVRPSPKTLAEKATVDLKPFASNAQKKIAAVIADFQKNEDGIRVAAEITKLRLADIAFDSRTLRVIAEAEGAINVYVSALPAL